MGRLLEQERETKKRNYRLMCIGKRNRYQGIYSQVWRLPYSALNHCRFQSDLLLDI